MKQCTGCGKTKPLDAFVRNKRHRSGRAARCKACVNAYYRKRYQDDPEKYLQRQRAWARANPEATREAARQRGKKWRTTNPERVRALQAASRKRLLESQPNYFRDWYHRNAEQQRERARLSMQRWRAEHPEGERERKRRYREANIDKVRKRERENTHRRRALMGATSPQLAEHMANLVTLPCAYCGAIDDITIDHIVPLSRGGKHEADNLTAACYSCNCSKGAKMLDEWLTESP